MKSVVWITITGLFISRIKNNISYNWGNFLQHTATITLPYYGTCKKKNSWNSGTNIVVLQWTKRIVILESVTWNKICPPLLFQKRLFPDKACKKALKTLVKCRNLSSLHRTKQKLKRCACLKVKSCFIKEQELLAWLLSML